MPVRKTKPTTLIQLKKDWEKEHLINILSQNRVKRKVIAFLLVYYLNDLQPFFEENPDMYPVENGKIFDIIGLDEEPYIVDALKIGWMRNFPDGKFYPDDDVKRFQLAIILYRVSKTLPFFHSKKVYHYEMKDVPLSDYTYKAITFAISNKFLRLEDGFFFRDRDVTGFEAARSFSKFRKILKK
ncbi:MAG: hypothetical protein E3J41_03445 [Candidatus Cloacimonadota bacterium]|nr:MAG: hypothetical protein E3J41_03445 [Candidatus Cloacimonadota bacterium]